MKCMKWMKGWSRMQQTLFFAAATVLLIILLLAVSGYHISAENVYRLYEKGEYLPDAETIHYFERDDGPIMMLGSNPYGIFEMRVQKKYGLWISAGSCLHYAEEQYPVQIFYVPEYDVIFGTVWIEGASQIYFEGRYSEEYENDVTGTAVLDENRCFITEASLYEHAKGAMKTSEKGCGLLYAELLDEDGNVIWKSDETTHWL